MRTAIRSFILVASLTTTGGVAAADDDDDVALEELPAAVRATVDSEVKHGQILEIERDHHRGKIAYEVEFLLDGLKYELDIAEDGTLLRRHRD